MGYPGNQVVSDTISTTSQSDTYPTHLAELGKGGWRSTPNLADSITTQRLEPGAALYVYNDNTTSTNNGLYIRNNANNGWTKVDLGSNFTLTKATDSALGGVRIPSGGVITIDNDGDIDVQKASTSQFGVVKIGTGLAIDSNNGTLKVTAANLTVKKDNNSFGSYPTLAFTGNGVSVTDDSNNSQNKVEINLPQAGVGNSPSFEEFNKIVFKSSSTSLTITPTTSGTTPNKTYTVELALGGSGTLKQHLYELSDVGTGSGTLVDLNPLDGYVLKYDLASSKWKAAQHNTGIQFGDLQATTPLNYSTTTPTGKGTFSILQANSGQDGFLSSSDWGTFSGKASWPTNPASDYAKYYLGPQGTSSETPDYELFKDSYLNEYSKSVRLVCRTVSGQSVAAGDIVAVTTTSNSDGKPIVRKADSTFTNIIGIATEGKSGNTDIVIMIEGIVSVDTTAYVSSYTGPVYATLTSSGYTLASSPTANSILVGYTIFNNSPGFFLIDIQQLASSGTYTLSVSNPAAASINLSQNGSGTITYTGNSGAITSLTLTGGRVGQRIPLRILQQATWNAGNTFTIAANWASGTTYGAAAIVRFEDSTDNTVAYYISLQVNNVNKNPKTETTWWSKYITLPFGRDIALSPYNSAEDVLMLNVTNTITVSSTVYPRIVIDTLYNV
jgi:hypothetical protein